MPSPLWTGFEVGVTKLLIECANHHLGCQVDGKVAACLGIFAKTCNSREGWDSEGKLESITEIINNACCMDPDNDWVTEPSIALHQSLILQRVGYENVVPCVVQWCILWYPHSSPIFRRLMERGLLTSPYEKPFDTALRQCLDMPVSCGMPHAIQSLRICYT